MYTISQDTNKRNRGTNNHSFSHTSTCHFIHSTTKAIQIKIKIIIKKSSLANQQKYKKGDCATTKYLNEQIVNESKKIKIINNKSGWKKRANRI